IEEARPQIDEAAWAQATLVIVAANLTFALETRAAALGRPLGQDDVERLTWERVQQAKGFSAADYARAIHTVHRTGRAVARFLESYDVILTPTMAKPPHPLGVLDLSSPDTAAFVAARTASVGFTAVVLIPVARPADPIRIGLGMALTGGLSANGKPALLAMQIWKDEINKKGGLLGRPVELIYYVFYSNPATVPEIYTKLLDV